MNLTTKFDELQQFATTLHNQRMAAIAALRAETAIYQVNAAIWTLAGPAPGVTLAQLKTALEAVAGGKSISDLVQLWFGSPAPYTVLANIYAALTASGLSQTAANDLLTRIIYQFDQPVVTPTMKEIVSDISDHFAQDEIEICDTPFRSNGADYISVSLDFIDSFTVAAWPETAPDGYAITTVSGAFGRTIIQCAEWSQYKILVDSRASMFGVSLFGTQRFDTNRWVILSGSDDLELFVNGNEYLDVNICHNDTFNPNDIQNPDPGGCYISYEQYGALATFIIVGSFTSNNVVYNTYRIDMPAVPGLLLQVGSGIARLDPEFILNHPAGWVVVCVGWDFTNNNIWPYFNRIFASSADNFQFSMIKPLSFEISIHPDGYMSEMFSNNAGFYYIAYDFAAPAHLGMPNNVYVHVHMKSGN